MKIAHQLVINVMDNGAMQIQGPIADVKWCLKLLDHAKDAIKNNQRPKEGLVIPSKDTDL